MIPIRHTSKAAEYRALAEAEITAGAAARLEQVRIKHERAAQVFIDLAAAEDARIEGRSQAMAAQAARLATASKAES